MSTTQLQQIRNKAERGDAESQLLMSQFCRRNGDEEGAVQWLRKASEQGHAEATSELGYCHEKGLGLEMDPASALGLYDQAISGGSVNAGYNKAELLYKSKDGPDHQREILELLVRAANGDSMSALCALGYLALQTRSARALAIDCFKRAAQLGDAVSSFKLGWCLLNGPDDDTDPGAAVHCLNNAAQVDYPFAADMLASLQGVQPEPPSAGDATVIEITQDIPIYPARHGVVCHEYSADPPVRLYEGVLDTIDCAYLVFLSRPFMERATVIDPESQKGGMVSQVRTSSSTYLTFDQVDIIGRFIELKIICETGDDLERSEPMSILHYSSGQYYRPHVDYFDPKLPVSKGLMDNGGQRTASAVTYLKAPESGGGTSFPKLDLHVPAAQGGTLWFRNSFDDGRIDERTLHAGEPVEEGEKWVVTKWYRQRPTNYLPL